MINYARIIVNYQKIKNGVYFVNTYKLTVFEPNGEKLLDESFQANDDQEAKNLGEKLLEEKNYSEKTHRCTSPKGKLILFHP